MNLITIKPVPSRTVRDPATGIEITEPTPVNADDAFWIRRLADGDVEKLTADQVAALEAAQRKAETEAIAAAAAEAKKAKSESEAK